MMLYDVVCHHLPLVGSGGDPLYIELYQTTIQGLPGLVASILIHPHIAWSQSL